MMEKVDLMQADFTDKMISQTLSEALESAKAHLHTGEIATYIPELAKANPAHIGACVMTMQGECFCVGDCQESFTIQSVGKTAALILALQIAGKEEVFSRVGVEPTGDAFNSLVKLETKTRFPLNPMINAGAIATASCCVGKVDDAYAAYLELLSKLCGNKDISMDENVYRSESMAGLRNRSMAYLMQGEGVLGCDADDALDLYFKMCSTITSTKDLANYALILANNGKNPQTGEVLLENWIVRVVKTVMLTCGMYDASGEFAMKVGIPAKSGVAGGIMACAEHKLGISTYGPALNSEGNSVGGLIILEHLSNRLGLHLFGGNVYYGER